MENVNWSVIISGIALLAAILSPVITTIINNIHETKMSNRRYYQEHRAEVIENFIRYAGAINELTGRDFDFREYGKCSKEIYLYIPEELWSTVDEIDKYIIACEYDKISDKLSDFCKALKKYPPRSVKIQRNRK